MRKDNSVDPREMIALEEELAALKKEHGLEKQTWWMKTGDWIAGKADRPKTEVDRKIYVKLALSLGWLCGAHRFYAKRKQLGILYLLFCWTGIPFAMTLVDLMIALPMLPDERGKIYI